MRMEELEGTIKVHGIIIESVDEVVCLTRNFLEIVSSGKIVSEGMAYLDIKDDETVQGTCTKEGETARGMGTKEGETACLA